MKFFSRMKEQRFLGFSMLLTTLSVGILIGTLLNTGVKAGKEQTTAPDASPLVIPNAVQVQNEFAKLAKRAENSVVHINTVDDGKEVVTARRGRPQPQDDDEEEDPNMELFRRFFRNGPQGQGGL